MSDRSHILPMPEGEQFESNRFAGLSVLLGLIALLLVVPMLRNRAPWHWMGPAILLLALAMDVRIPLRPELFGFLMLAGQWAMLSGPGFGWKRAAGMFAVTPLGVWFVVTP